MELTVKKLITKLILNSRLVCEAHGKEHSCLITQFWNDHNDFQNKFEHFNCDHFWVMVEDPTMDAHISMTQIILMYYA